MFISCPQKPVNRNCSTSVTFLLLLYSTTSLLLTPCIISISYIYIYFVQYTCSQRKNNSKSSPPPIPSSSEYHMHVSNVVYYQEQTNKCKDELRGVLLDEAGVRSTFSTTLNKKSHANRLLLCGFVPVSSQKLIVG